MGGGSGSGSSITNDGLTVPAFDGAAIVERAIAKVNLRNQLAAQFEGIVDALPMVLFFELPLPMVLFDDKILRCSACFPPGFWLRVFCLL